MRATRFILAALVQLATLVAAEEPSPDTRWKSANGAWTDGQHWSAGVPGPSTRVTIHGQSELRLPRLPQPATAGAMSIGTLSGDKVRLQLDGGQLVARRDYMHAGEADGSDVELLLNDGALHGVSSVYVGGSGEKRVGACRALLRIRGGSFVSRLLTVGSGQRADATLAIEGSRASAVHVLDWISMGVPIIGREPSISTLAFTLDEHGVTPITVQARRTGLRLYKNVAGNRCRLQVSVSAVPPRDDITLLAAHSPTIGTFDDLPESAEIYADHAGRTYTWTLTYHGGENQCHVMLRNVRGHAPDAPVTKCRPIPAVPVPLWETIPARADDPMESQAPLAFEGAEGFGRHAAGGRGGPTLWVENLNDSGPGSFREAVLTRGPRIIQFRVGGAIELKSPISIAEPFLTVNGDSAPDGGITFTGSGFVVHTHDVILRHLRIRPGDATEDMDALNFHDAQRCIADHLSLSWATDEVLSISGLSDAVTVQWCLISEGLNRAQHGYASIAGGERVTWHHNLLAHHVSRVPRFAGIVRADFRNNVLYNWGHTAGYGQFERVNYVANYLKPGPSTKQKPPLIHLGVETVGDATLHLEGNVMHGSDAVTRDNWLSVGFEPRVRAEKPFAAPPVHTTDAPTAYESVLAQAGSLPAKRDATDSRVMQEVRSGTGRIINHTTDAAATTNHDAMRFSRVVGPAEGGSVLGNGSADAFDARWTSCPSVVFHDGVYRMWYSSWFTPGFGPTGIGLATSTDGIKWTRANQALPVLTPGVTDAFDSACAMGPAVHHDGTRYLMWYTGTTNAKHASGFYSYRIGVATSRDGISWTRANNGKPVIDLGPPGSPDEVQVATPSVIREKDGYLMWYAAYAPQSNHTICVARSADGIAWRRENGGQSVTGLNPSTAFGHAVCKVGDICIMLYMSLTKPPGLYAARSDDGLAWHMLNDGQPVIAPSGSGYDRDLVGHPFLLCDKDELRAWITGYDRQKGGVKEWRLGIGLLNGPLPMLKN